MRWVDDINMKKGKSAPEMLLLQEMEQNDFTFLCTEGVMQV